MDINESVLAPTTASDALADLHQRASSCTWTTRHRAGLAAHLHKIEVDTIKIDHSFLAGGADRDRQCSRASSRSRATWASRLIAEGVETKEQARLVREVGCSFAQGFFFSPRSIRRNSAPPPGRCWSRLMRSRWSLFVCTDPPRREAGCEAAGAARRSRRARRSGERRRRSSSATWREKRTSLSTW